MAALELLKRFLHEGGFTAYLTFGSAIALIIISVERLYYLYFQVKSLGTATTDHLKELVLKRQYTSALQVCNASEHIPELKVIKSGLLAVDSGREAMKSSLGGSLVEISEECEKRVPIVALIASVATLLGLLGTISGLIRSFAALATADPAHKAEMLGAGISEAMVSTAAGLIVGISALVVHTFCTSKADAIVGGAKKMGFSFIALIEKSERGE